MPFNDLVINFFSEHSLNIMVMTEIVKKKLCFQICSLFFARLSTYLGKFEQNKFIFFIACLKFCVEEFLVDVQCRDVLKGVCVIIA